MQSESIDERTLALLDEATQSANPTLDVDQVLRDLDGWDSMGMVMFIGLVKRAHGVDLSVHDLHDSRTVSDLIGLVRTRAGA
ncbi:MAG: acyl carrier protein [Planctomycetota bacterium]